MRRRYSRLARSEEKRNIRKAFFWIALTILALVGFLFYGFPTVARLSTFLSELRKGSEPVDINDKTPPAPPRIDTPPEVTNELTVKITGSTEEGATVFIFTNGKEEEILANKEGQFSYTFKLRKGANTFSAKVKDAAGNESTETETITITYDNEPPILTILSPADGQEFFGSRERQITIQGETEEGAGVTINDRVVVVDSQSKFAFATTLSEGENTFNIKAFDKAGNEAETSIILRFTP